MIRVLVNGAQGKMGCISVQALRADQRFDVVAEVTRGDDLVAVMQASQPKVVLDFTLPDCVFANATKIIEFGACPVIGTSGLTLAQIDELTLLARARNVAGIIVPNFSVAAVLMMRFAEQAAAFLPNVHIVELHHDKKVDAPSGTARKTAELLSATMGKTVEDGLDIPGCYQGIPIHSVRLPSLFAHQAVVFSAEGETLSIKHDADSRQCMMPGVTLACEKVLSLSQLHYGLGVLLD